MLELLRIPAGLGVDEFQFVASREFQRCTDLGAHADPVESGGSRLGSVCFHRDIEATSVQCVDNLGIELEQGFTARADNHAVLAVSVGPGIVDGLGQCGRIMEATTTGTIGSDEVGVTERADRTGAVFFAPSP